MTVIVAHGIHRQFFSIENASQPNVTSNSPDSTPSGSPKAPTSHHSRMVTCIICGEIKSRHGCTPVAALRPGIIALIAEEHPGLPHDAFICHDDVGRFRARYVGTMLKAERGELGRLEREVLESVEKHDIVSADVESSFLEKRTFGEKMSDGLASFGGSWHFIGFFAALMVLWMGVNIAAARAFDPYPFILLNLVLSCLAALQAPIIMMSQKRQEVKDRLRSENDYRVNLKAELEIRQLHEKIDHILNRQWDRLAEIQEIQMEMMEDALHSAAPTKK